MATIKLSNGGSTQVSPEDYDELIKYSWRRDSMGYVSSVIKGKFTSMHRVVNKTPKGMFTDHINRDVMDNRRENLRTCTNKQNRGNSKPAKGSVSKYKGVYRNFRDAKWYAQIRVDGKSFHLGMFACEDEAAKAYNKAALIHFGEFARINTIGEKQ